MKPRKLYKITVSDEARLDNIFARTFSVPMLLVSVTVFLLFSAALGFLIVIATPLKSLIPGHLGDSQRAATENAIMRVDSLRDAYALNEQYIANIKSILGGPVNRQDTSSVAPGAIFSISADSLLPKSIEEERFVSSMQNHVAFNISRRASIAAEDMMLYPVSPDGIVAQESLDSYSAHVLLPGNASVLAIADGRVLASYYDVKSKKYVIIAQHDRGFVSKISGLPIPFVGNGDELSGGEAIAVMTPAGNNPVEISVELWFDGVPVKPYDYIAGRRYLRSPSSKSSSSVSSQYSDIP